MAVKVKRYAASIELEIDLRDRGLNEDDGNRAAVKAIEEQIISVMPTNVVRAWVAYAESPSDLKRRKQ